MGDLSFSTIDHEITFGLHSDLPCAWMASSQAAFFPQPASL